MHRPLLYAPLLVFMICWSPYSDASVLFGYKELLQADHKDLFPKWNGVVHRAASDSSKLANCVPDFFTWCFQNSLNKFKPKIAKKTRLEQMAAVSRFINKLSYKSDSLNWGVRDYWAVRWEFFGKNKGDCEDYAIAKYYTLKDMGFDIDSMRLVVVKDTNIDRGHAVLVVELNGKRYVLDNRGSGISLQSRIVHYKPVYSLNEHHWWRYRAVRNIR